MRVSGRDRARALPRARRGRPCPAGWPFRSFDGFGSETRPVTDRADRAAREEAEGPRPSRHPRKVSDEGFLDAPAAFALRIPNPELQGLVEVRERDERTSVGNAESAALAARRPAAGGHADIGVEDGETCTSRNQRRISQPRGGFRDVVGHRRDRGESFALKRPAQDRAPTPHRHDSAQRSLKGQQCRRPGCCHRDAASAHRELEAGAEWAQSGALPAWTEYISSALGAGCAPRFRLPAALHASRLSLRVEISDRLLLQLELPNSLFSLRSCGD